MTCFSLVRWWEKDQYVLISIKEQQKIITNSQFYEEGDTLCHGYLCEIKKMIFSQTYRKSSCSWTKLFILKKHYSTHMHHFLYVACCSTYCVCNRPIITWALNTTDGLVEKWEAASCDAFVGKSVVTAEKWNCHVWEILVEYLLFYVSKFLFSTLQSMTFYCIMTE